MKLPKKSIDVKKSICKEIRKLMEETPMDRRKIGAQLFELLKSVDSDILLAKERDSFNLIV